MKLWAHKKHGNCSNCRCHMDNNAIEVFINPNSKPKEIQTTLYRRWNNKPQNIPWVRKEFYKQFNLSMHHLRIVGHWYIHIEFTTNRSCDAFTIPATMHGTQFYLTIEERDKVYNADLSNNPEIEKHRAFIIFQPMVAELVVYSLLRRTMLLVTYCSIFHTRLCASSRRPWAFRLHQRQWRYWNATRASKRDFFLQNKRTNITMASMPYFGNVAPTVWCNP